MTTMGADLLGPAQQIEYREAMAHLPPTPSSPPREEDGADDTIKTFWVIEPLKPGETSMEKGPKRAAISGCGKAAPRAGTTRGPSRRKPARSTPERTSRTCRFCAAGAGAGLSSRSYAMCSYVLCGFDEHEGAMRACRRCCRAL